MKIYMNISIKTPVRRIYRKFLCFSCKFSSKATLPHPARYLLTALILGLFFGCAVSAVPAQASAYATAAKAKAPLTSTQHGWVKIGKYYYFYDTSGRLLYGKIKYQGNYYYSRPSGRRQTGWITKGGKRYYCNKKTGIMYRNQWVQGTTARFYFNKYGAALCSQWLTQNEKKYYFLSNCTMAVGWQKIGSYYYYFDTSTGVMAADTWINGYYINTSGQRSSTKKGAAVTTQNKSKTHYVYKSPTLSVDLRKKSTHGVTYWVAHVKTAKASQLKSALSYGTYGGKRQTTSSAVSSNGGIIGINGSAFSYSTGKPSPLGMCIKNSIIYGDYKTSYSVMAVKTDGTIYTPEMGLSGKELLAQGVKDTYNFGPVLIKDGEAQPSWAETDKYYPRTAIGMVAPNDYVILVTSTGNYSGLNHSDMIKIFQSYGCQYAYNLDGGGSSTLYYNGQVMNATATGSERPCADFLYFTN